MAIRLDSMCVLDKEMVIYMVIYMVIDRHDLSLSLSSRYFLCLPVPFDL